MPNIIVDKITRKETAKFGELKPGTVFQCPFCMSTAEIFCSMGNKTVRCSNKKCIAHNIMSTKTDIKKEIEQWNMRVKSVTRYGKPFMENAITYFEHLAKKYKKDEERDWLIGKSKKECENIRIQKEYVLLAVKAIKRLSQK